MAAGGGNPVLTRRAMLPAMGDQREAEPEARVEELSRRMVADQERRRKAVARRLRQQLRAAQGGEAGETAPHASASCSASRRCQSRDGPPPSAKRISPRTTAVVSYAFRRAFGKNPSRASRLIFAGGTSRSWPNCRALKRAGIGGYRDMAPDVSPAAGCVQFV